jgi:hypothetical protein
MLYTILLDFDGTCVTHEFPKVGDDIGAVPVLKELVENGNRLILFTMRGSGELSLKKFGTDGLQDAVNWFATNGIPLYGIQTNPTQHTWTNSPKPHGDLIIDDTAIGIPLIYDPKISKGVFVDWKKLREMLITYEAIKIKDNDKEGS